jgi:glutathione S-transferase
MSVHHYRLVIGDKNWSSWSLRPWLAMRRAGVPFEEINIRLRRPESKAEILKHSPSGLVPTLIDGALAVWDSLAILEYVAERHPDTQLWPRDVQARTVARCVAAEMHSGFAALRRHCPMELLAHHPQASLPPEVAADVGRIVAVWRDCRARFGANGPFLFSDFSVADAMYAPVCSRLRTYVADLAPYGDDGTAQAYVEAVFAMPEMTLWAEGAREQMAAQT